MSEKDLDHRKSYEWYGTFWFPNTDESLKYSGKLSYSPASGIQLSLQEIDVPVSTMKALFSQGYTTARKIMHASVHGETGLQHLTLFNVFIPNWSSNLYDIKYTGFAEALICDIHCDKNTLLSIGLQYVKHYENFFLSREQDAVAFYKAQGLLMDSGIEIALKFKWSGTPIISLDNLDSIFWDYNDPELKEIKKAFAPIIEREDNHLTKFHHTEFQTSLTNENLDFENLFKQERIWRSFFELMLNHPVSVLKVKGVYESEISDKKVYKQPSPMLCSNFIPQKQKWEPRNIRKLPITYFKIGSMDRNLSDLKGCMEKWFEITNSEDWSPVINGINRLMNIGEAFGDAIQYSALKADIETFIDLANLGTANIDTLVEYVASEEWKKNISSKLSFSPRRTLGQHFAEIRNSIIHPVGTKNKACGFYSEIRKDSLKLQIAYAYLGALYLKAVLTYLDVADDEARESYANNFIDLYANYRPINFE